MENFFEFLKEDVTSLDIILILFVLYNLVSGIKNGLIGSLLSFSKWVIAFLAVKYLLPISRPYVDGFLSSEFVTDLILGTSIFFITLYLVLLINKGLRKTVKWSGLGSIDTLFGCIFGFIRGYFYFIIIFSIVNLAHPYERWHDSLNKGATFKIIMWGNELIVDNFPKRYEYLDKSKEKLKKLK